MFCSTSVSLSFFFILTLLSISSSAIDLYVCVTGSVNGCCTATLYSAGATCDVGAYSIGLVNNLDGCGNPKIAVNYFYVSYDNNKDYWGGCLSAIPYGPLNYTTVEGFNGFYQSAMGRSDIQYQIQVSVLS